MEQSKVSVVVSNDDLVQISEGLSISHGDVFSNRVVLETIFKNSSARDLKEFRLMNQLWNEASLSVLIKRRLLTLTVTDCPHKLHRKYTFPSSVLAEVNSHFSDISKRLPFTSLDFDIGCWNDTTKFLLKQSLKFLGSKITTLTLSKRHGSAQQQVTVLRDLLLIFFPNVKKLVLECLSLAIPLSYQMSNEEDSFKLFHVPVTLLSLQTIYLPTIWPYPSILKELVVASPNLKCIKHFDICMIDIIQKTGKIDLIKEYSHNYAFGCPRNFFRFSDLYPKLKILVVPNIIDTVNVDDNEEEEKGHRLQEFVAFRKILRSSKDTLECLTCYPYYFLSPNKNEQPIPIFTNLLKLCLLYPSASYMASISSGLLPVFPEKLDVLNVFPTVRSIVFKSEFKLLDLCSLVKYFPYNDTVHEVVVPWPSVTKLEIGYGCLVTFDGWTWLEKKFPNVKHFIGVGVSSIFASGNGLQLCMPWTELESLELRGMSLDMLCGFKMESFLTGVPIKEIENFSRTTSADQIDTETWNYIKNCRGVSDFQGLSQIKIVLDHSSSADWVLPDDFKIDSITSYSWEYGFKLLQKLRSLIFSFNRDIHNSEDVKFVLERMVPLCVFEHDPDYIW